MARPAASGRAMPSPELMDRLSTMRFVPPGARATTGVGERASRTSGPGMEFADFRTYRAGDDLRHVDPRSIARGDPFTRKYVQRRQFVVTIVLDLTASMMVQPDTKAALATGVARALGFVALSGQDKVRLVVLEGENGIRRSPLWQGRTRAPDMFAFAEPQIEAPRDREDASKRDASASLAAALTELIPSSDAGSLIFIVSDFWEADVAVALASLASTPATVTALHVLSASERDPSSLGQGIIRLVDAETGRERDMTIDETTLTGYRAALGRHTDTLVESLSGWNVFLPVDAEAQLSDVCLERLPVAGVIA
ncbi:DUF58 domain-containing protein [Devosia sp. 2618]|uniref:DUF58 domain-containing protein n=1 Tax=Devosia sp. 2618 TaxID=3156454 RepID=UPI00339287C8